MHNRVGRFMGSEAEVCQHFVGEGRFVAEDTDDRHGGKRLRSSDPGGDPSVLASGYIAVRPPRR
jgi:hypothetical protein